MALTIDELVAEMKERLGGYYVVAIVRNRFGEDVAVLHVDIDEMEDYPSFNADKLAELMGIPERDRLRAIVKAVDEAPCMSYYNDDDSVGYCVMCEAYGGSDHKADCPKALARAALGEK